MTMRTVRLNLPTRFNKTCFSTALERREHETAMIQRDVNTTLDCKRCGLRVL
jgi:hypothetical protein